MTKYTVYADDIFNLYDTSYRRKVGEYDSYEEAEAACRKVIDDFIQTYGTNEEELALANAHYGESPFVVPAGPEGESFSASKYYEEAFDNHFNSSNNDKEEKEKKSGKKLIGLYDVSKALKEKGRDGIKEVSEIIYKDVNEKIRKLDAKKLNMIYTPKMQDAINFSIEVHQLTAEPQFRKGKAVPYVTHPITVALILSQAGASEDVVVAGILHDTIEDCEPKGSVTKETIAEKFGETVAELVDSVTEKDRGLDWHARKEAALEEIKQFSNDSLLLKSGDVISNLTEIIADYEREGEDTFKRFNASKEEMLSHSLHVINTIVTKWPENSLASDLRRIEARVQNIL